MATSLASNSQAATAKKDTLRTLEKELAETKKDYVAIKTILQKLLNR